MGMEILIAIAGLADRLPGHFSIWWEGSPEKFHARIFLEGTID
jgi:hypothetical protein